VQFVIETKHLLENENLAAGVKLEFIKQRQYHLDLVQTAERVLKTAKCKTLAQSNCA